MFTVLFTNRHRLASQPPWLIVEPESRTAVAIENVLSRLGWPVLESRRPCSQPHTEIELSWAGARRTGSWSVSVAECLATEPCGVPSDEFASEGLSAAGRNPEVIRDVLIQGGRQLVSRYAAA